MKKVTAWILLIFTALWLAGCSSILGMGTIQVSDPEEYGKWEAYHTVPSFLPDRIDEYTVNAYSYTLYNYMDTCYEIFLDIRVTPEQFQQLTQQARQYADDPIERAAPYADGYTEIVFSDRYERGDVEKHDGLEQVGTAEIDKVIYHADTCRIIYVSFHAEDTGVYDVENIAYFNRFSITPDQYTTS